MIRPQAGVRVLVALLAIGALSACAAPATTTAVRGAPLSPAATAFLDTLSERTFRWFWDLSDSTTGMTPDRAPTPSFVSVGAVGFALTAYPIGAERGYVPRTAAVRRTTRTLEWLLRAPMSDSPSGATGYKGLYYHFLVPETGLRFKDTELSTQDTALLISAARSIGAPISDS